jgi:feruloyl esterase
MAPGMEHCFGGPGPSGFGQLGVAGGDADHDIEAALERWVEKGIAPGTIIGAKRGSDFDSASLLLRTMPICVWPKVPRYSGKGSTNEATNFTCY